MSIMLPISPVNNVTPTLVPHGLMFHHFHGGIHKADNAGSLSQLQFEMVLDKVGIENILTPHDWVSAFLANELEPFHICLTFDDALKSQIDVALPVLERYGLKAFWFIYSAPFQSEYPRLDLFRRFRYSYYDTIDDYYHDFFKLFGSTSFQSMTSYVKWCKAFSTTFPFYSENDLKFRYIRDVLLRPAEYAEMVEEMILSKGLSLGELAKNLWLTESDLRYLHTNDHMLGLHSHDHPTSISKLPYSQQRDQYLKNTKFIRTLSDGPISMSHPSNSYSEETLEILAELKIRVGFRSNMTKLNYIDSCHTNLQLPREDAVNILRQNS